jgi:hypothetical protein
MTRYAPAVFAALVGASDDEILDLLRLESRLLEQVLDDVRQKIVWAYLGERARMATEWRPQSFVNISIEHDGSFGFGMIRVRE